MNLHEINATLKMVDNVKFALILQTLYNKCTQVSFTVK